MFYRFLPWPVKLELNGCVLLSYWTTKLHLPHLNTKRQLTLHRGSSVFSCIYIIFFFFFPRQQSGHGFENENTFQRTALTHTFCVCSSLARWHVWVGNAVGGAFFSETAALPLHTTVPWLNKDWYRVLFVSQPDPFKSSYCDLLRLVKIKPAFCPQPLSPPLPQNKPWVIHM